MRRLLCWFWALSFVGALAGCHHTAGVCDCDIDDNPCRMRAPWYKPAPPMESKDAKDPGKTATIDLQ